MTEIRIAQVVRLPTPRRRVPQSDPKYVVQLEMIISTLKIPQE